MASDLEFVEYVVDQIKDAGSITYRKMFGEYAIYCEGKIVVLICDNQVFVKPTKAGKSFIGNVVEAPPYPGAKPSYLIEEQIEFWFQSAQGNAGYDIEIDGPYDKSDNGNSKFTSTSARVKPKTSPPNPCPSRQYVSVSAEGPRRALS